MNFFFFFDKNKKIRIDHDAAVAATAAAAAAAAAAALSSSSYRSFGYRTVVSYDMFETTIIMASSDRKNKSVVVGYWTRLNRLTQQSQRRAHIILQC